MLGRTATVDNGAGTVAVSVPYGTDRSTLAPTITVSDGATVSPVSGATADFSSGSVAYTVTAEDGVTQKVYNVTVSEMLQVQSVRLLLSLLQGQLVP